ncbi:MAG: tetratricopeptide repeat protein [Deltaproteobacteria bacterium]|nr:tetratricopeptide repeat protein [Deltaproteobacteria bacterium]
MKYLIAACFITGCFFAVPSGADAGDTDQEAKAAFDRGRKLFGEEQYAEAADQFRKANELKPNWKILYNIGQCEAAARRYGLAIEMFQEYLALGGDGVPLERRDEILEEVKRLQLMVGYMEFQGGPNGAELTVDGVKRGALPLSGSVAVASGVEHIVVITSNGDVVYERVLKLMTGQSKVFDVDTTAESDAAATVSPAARAETPVVDEAGSESSDSVGDPAYETVQPADTEPPPDAHRSLKVVGVTSLSFGLAALAGWGVAGGLALKFRSDLQSDCEPDGCPPQREDDQMRLSTMLIASSVLLGVGAGFTALGVLLLAVHRKKGTESSSAVTAAPVFSSEFAGAAVMGRF